MPRSATSRQDQPELTELTLEMAASTERVFAELADGWAYVGWVVGANHIRDVDGHWPQPGSRIHHRVGSWPLTLSDVTESVECEPGRRLRLRAKGWPLGEALVELVLEPIDAGHTTVRLREAPLAGPGRWLDNPALRWGLRRRNEETLRRLRDRVEHRNLG
ncbi:MAG TPA: SRPBCC family protein [Jatrophihabitans sp.]|nr:SRPBCC family protein [Jatrophihabitans sp.]